MQKPPDSDYPYVLSYLGLRRCIGVIGISLPFVLVFGKLLFGSPGLLPSLSAYYYTVMRDVFVGALCATAVFLLSYRFDRLSDIAGDVAGISALGIAFFPTPPAAGATHQQMLIGYAHSVFSGVFFLTLAFFALVLFQRTDPGCVMTPQKRRSNSIYVVTGLVILACVALSVADLFLHSFQTLQALNPGLWLESLAIFAFGVAWFVKGRTIMQDV